MAKNKNHEPKQQYTPISHDEEYSVVRKDLYKVLALNTFYLIVLLGLFFANRSSHIVDNFFARLLHF